MECRPQTKGKPAVACRVRCEVPRFRAAFNANLLKEVFLCSKTKSLHKNPTFPSGSLPKKKRYFTAQKIAYLAVFVALNVVVGIFSPRLGTLKITLTYTVCFLAGYFFGPIAGGLVGGLGDVIGCFVGGGYAPNPVILCASVLIGVIPGLTSYIKIKKLGGAKPYVNIAISYILVYVVCTLFINTYALYLMGLSKGQTFFAYMGVRAVTQTPVTAINIGLTFLIYPVFSKIFSASFCKSE